MEREIRQVQDFHEAFGLHVSTTPSAVLPPGAAELRATLLQEELDEYREAAEAGDLEGIADALTDLAYVLFGTYASHGLQSVADELFAEVHRSNMSKLDADGRPVRRADGKILKSDRFSKPELGPILEAARGNGTTVNGSC